MVKENLYMSMEIYLRENGLKIKLMDMEFIFMLMELSMVRNFKFFILLINFKFINFKKRELGLVNKN